MNLRLSCCHDHFSTLVTLRDRVDVAVLGLELVQLDLLVGRGKVRFLLFIWIANLSFEGSHELEIFARLVDDCDECYRGYSEKIREKMD